MERGGFLQCASTRADVSTAIATLSFILCYSENADDRGFGGITEERRAWQGVSNLDRLVTHCLPLPRMTTIIYVPSKAHSRYPSRKLQVPRERLSRHRHAKEAVPPRRVKRRRVKVPRAKQPVGFWRYIEVTLGHDELRRLLSHMIWGR